MLSSYWPGLEVPDSLTLLPAGDFSSLLLGSSLGLLPIWLSLKRGIKERAAERTPEMEAMLFSWSNLRSNFSLLLPYPVFRSESLNAAHTQGMGIKPHLLGQRAGYINKYTTYQETDFKTTTVLNNVLLHSLFFRCLFPSLVVSYLLSVCVCMSVCVLKFLQYLVSN